jgi:hypothetical protein
MEASHIRRMSADRIFAGYAIISPMNVTTRILRGLRKRAKSIGFDLVDTSTGLVMS